MLIILLLLTTIKAQVILKEDQSKLIVPPSRKLTTVVPLHQIPELSTPREPKNLGESYLREFSEQELSGGNDNSPIFTTRDNQEVNSPNLPQNSDLEHSNVNHIRFASPDPHFHKRIIKIKSFGLHPLHSHFHSEVNIQKGPLQPPFPYQNQNPHSLIHAHSFEHRFEKPTSFQQSQNFGSSQAFGHLKNFDQPQPFIHHQNFDHTKHINEKQIFGQPQNFVQEQNFDQTQNFAQDQRFGQNQNFAQFQIFNQKQTFGKPQNFALIQQFGQSQAINQPFNFNQAQNFNKEHSVIKTQNGQNFQDDFEISNSQLENSGQNHIHSPHISPAIAINKQNNLFTSTFPTKENIQISQNNGQGSSTVQSQVSKENAAVDVRASSDKNIPHSFIIDLPTRYDPNELFSVFKRSVNEDRIAKIIHSFLDQDEEMFKIKKLKTKRAAPLLRLVTDPNVKLDVEKTIKNLGAVTRHSLEDKRAPMYHMRSMLGSTKNALLSALRVPPQNLIIPSQYKIIDLKNNDDRTNENLLDPILGVPKFTNNKKLSLLEKAKLRIEELRKKKLAVSQPNKPNLEDSTANEIVKLPSPSLQNDDDLGFLETFQKIGIVLRESIKSGQETLQHMGDAAHSARKIFATSRLSAPRVLLPYANAPVVTSRNNFGGVDDGSKTEKVMLIAPKVFDVKKDSLGPTPGEDTDDFVGAGHILDALGISSPEERNFKLTKIVMHQPITEENNVTLNSRFKSNDIVSAKNPVPLPDQKFYIVTDHISPKDEAGDTFETLDELKHMLGGRDVKEFLTKMKLKLEQLKNKQDDNMVGQKNMLDEEEQLQEKNSVNTEKEKGNQKSLDILSNSPEYLKNIGDKIESQITPQTKNDVNEKEELKKNDLNEKENRREYYRMKIKAFLEKILQNRREKLLKLQKQKTKIPSNEENLDLNIGSSKKVDNANENWKMLDKFKKKSSEYTKNENTNKSIEENENNIENEEREKIIEENIKRVFGRSVDETVGLDLPLGPELLKPFMGLPSKTEVRTFLEENGDDIDPFEDADRNINFGLVGSTFEESLKPNNPIENMQPMSREIFIHGKNFMQQRADQNKFMNQNGFVNQNGFLDENGFMVQKDFEKRNGPVERNGFLNLNAVNYGTQIEPNENNSTVEYKDTEQIISTDSIAKHKKSLNVTHKGYITKEDTLEPNRSAVIDEHEQKYAILDDIIIGKIFGDESQGRTSMNVPKKLLKPYMGEIKPKFYTDQEFEEIYPDDLYGYEREDQNSEQRRQ